MNIFKKLFYKKNKKIKDEIDEHEQLLIEKIIEVLKTKPECFSARWCDKELLNDSVQSNNKKILIYKNGEILHPIHPKMTKNQKTLIKELIDPIIKKDSEYIIKHFIESM